MALLVTSTVTPASDPWQGVEGENRDHTPTAVYCHARLLARVFPFLHGFFPVLFFFLGNTLFQRKFTLPAHCWTLGGEGFYSLPALKEQDISVDKNRSRTPSAFFRLYTYSTYSEHFFTFGERSFRTLLDRSRERERVCGVKCVSLVFLFLLVTCTTG